jgi:hypothetical protein
MRSQRPLLSVLLALAALAPLAGCGGSSSSGTSSPAAPSSHGTAPSSAASSATSSSGTESSSGDAAAFCRRAGGISHQTAAELAQITRGGGSRPAKTKAEFGLILARFRQVTAMAPSDVKPSLEISLAGIERFDQMLARDGYKVTPAELVSSPLGSARFRRAARNVRTWVAAHCQNG